ncbi:hypothetical protein MAR_020637 [Mya arenaria]|uniref:Uncharacterized protein n=1 Tax=Mya arenaria TaxID=6604 RepID=A0ABY7E5F7_MYAAR|nr:hypothetical protein MAR_020637 [Mya arenaria]
MTACQATAGYCKLNVLLIKFQNKKYLFYEHNDYEGLNRGQDEQEANYGALTLLTFRLDEINIE